MLAHNKIQGGNSQDHYQLPPPQQQPQRHEHRPFVHQHQFPEHHGRFCPQQLLPQTQAPQKRMYHHEDEHERHYSVVGQDPLYLHQHHQHHARSHRQVDLSRPRNRNVSSATLASPTIHPTIANMVSPISPHCLRSHPYSHPPHPSSTTATPPRPSSAYRSFSPVSSSSSSSSSSPSSSRNVSLSPGLESEAMMHPSRSRSSPSHHHLPIRNHHRHPSSISAVTASRGHPAPLRRGDEMAEMKREYATEELSFDSMMDQCEPQREWSTSSSQHTNSPSPVMCSSSYPVAPAYETSSPPHQHPALQKHYHYCQEERDEEDKSEKESDCQLKRQFGDQYTHTSLPHQHPRSSQRHWQPHRWNQQEEEKEQQHNERKRDFDHGLESVHQQQQKQEVERIILPPSPTSHSRHVLSRRCSGSTIDSTTATVTSAVLPSPSLSSTTAVPLPSSTLSSPLSASLTRRMSDLSPPRKQQRSSHSFYPVPNSPNNASSPSPQYSSHLPSSSSTTTSFSSLASLPPLRPVSAGSAMAAAVMSLSVGNNNSSTHAPPPSIPFALSSTPILKSTSGCSSNSINNSSGRSLPPLPLLPSTTSTQQQQTQPPPSPTTKLSIDVYSEPRSYEYRSKAQWMLYERHPPSPINNNSNNSNKNSRSASNSPSSSPLSRASEGERLSAPPSPVHAPLPANTLANRASFGSLREYQSDRRQHSHISYQQSHHHYPLQHPQQQQQQRQQYPQQISLLPSSSLSQYQRENRLPQMGRSQQQHPKPYRHSYHGQRAGSANGLELPKLSSLAFSQRSHVEPESHSSSMSSVSSGRSVSGGPSGSSSSSSTAVFSSLPRPPTPASMDGRGHGQMSVSTHQHRHQQQHQQPFQPHPQSLYQHRHQQQIQQPLPGTEGMTVVRNEEGAIMVYNPITDAITFRCELCPGESFGRIHDLKRHQTSKHQEMTWPCDFCHRPFVRRDALLRHYTVKAARDDGLHPASHEIDRLLAARARAKMLY